MRRTRLMALCLLFLPFAVQSQNYTTLETAGRKLQKLYEQAKYFNQLQDFPAAEKELMALIAIDPTFVDAFILLGNIRYNQNDMAAAEKSYREALNIAPDYQHRIWYQTAIVQLRQGKYEAAEENLNYYLSIGDDNPGLQQRAKQHLTNAIFGRKAIENPVPFRLKALNPGINTSAPEYCPVISADGQKLIFNRVVNGQEDFFISQKKEGEWQTAIPLQALNSPYNEGASSFSADGRFMVFTACNRRDGLGRCDLYYSEYKNEQWQLPANAGSPLNSRYWDSQPSLSSDGKILVFSSDRPGGKGGRDLWWSHKTAEGSWALPQNLGDAVNSAGDEQSPFLHADGQTLYFMSEGHTGMGGFDLFFSKRQNDGSWSDPQNLGYPINTYGNEGALVISLDGKTAWFDSDFRSPESGMGIDPKLKGNADIYTFELYPEARPIPVTYLKAIVTDARSGERLQAHAEITELPKGSVFNSSPASETGELLVCLPAGKTYALNISHPGYAFFSENFELTDFRDSRDPFVMEIALQPLETSIAGDTAKPIVLKNIFFETGSAELLNSSVPELRKLANLMTENPDISIQIQGHTDNVGSESDNLLLSEARARAVYTYLLEQGIAAERLSFTGFGESRPIDSNETEEGRKNNRRTAFIILRTSRE